ncbi:MAG: IS110 family transposase [Actinomycetes bacterium]
MTIYVGIDWAEEHHDICVLDGASKRLGSRRVPDGVAGVAQLRELIAAHADNPATVTIGIELDRGLLITALLAVGYNVVKIEPLATARYRDWFASSRGKFDSSDARVVADAVRTDGHLHRRLDGDTELVEAVRVLARTMVWEHTRQIQRLRRALREYFPAALSRDSIDDRRGVR